MKLENNLKNKEILEEQYIDAIYHGNTALIQDTRTTETINKRIVEYVMIDGTQLKAIHTKVSAASSYKNVAMPFLEIKIIEGNAERTIFYETYDEKIDQYRKAHLPLAD